MIEVTESGLAFFFNNEEILTLEKSGTIKINGSTVATDVKVVYGIREALKHLELKDKAAHGKPFC